MMEAIRSVFALIALTVKIFHNAFKGLEVMSKEVELSARSLAADQKIDREITALKAKAKLAKQLKALGITEEQLRSSAKARAEAADQDDAGNLA